MLNYLKVANLQVALLVNFKHAKLEFKRVVRSHCTLGESFTVGEAEV
jgi:hypothetical protein